MKAIALLFLLACSAVAQVDSQPTEIPLLQESRFLVGVNYPWHQQDGIHYFGNLFGEMNASHKAAITRAFREMGAAGIRVQRFWVFAGGGRWPERTNGAFQPLPERWIADMRWFVREAARFGIYSMPSIWDFYLNRDHRDWIADDTLSAQVVDTCVKPMLQALASEPGILIWDVMNEPEWTLKRPNLKSDRAKWTERFNLGPDVGVGHEHARVRAFLQRNVDAVHAAGGRATIGAVSWITVRLWREMGLDEYQIHFYPVGQNYQLADEQFNLIPKAKYLRLDRPVMLGEFPPNVRDLDLYRFLERIRDFGYSGALGWAWLAPENHNFTFKARLDEVRRFNGK